MFERHRTDVEKIRTAFLELKCKEGISLQSSSCPSNVTRAGNYKAEGAKIDINCLNRVLLVDPIERIAVVEPRVTMEQLAKATIEYGMIVPVVPEFKGITVGGAILGAGLESASHRYGLFSDQALSYEILLGDGSIVRATPRAHADLFYGIVGSYGSLGILLSVELKLILAKSYVRLRYHAFDKVSDALQHISAIAPTKVDFLEGFVFAKDQIAVVAGSFLALEEKDTVPRTFSQKFPWSPWFYPHVKQVLKSKEKEDEKMPIFDYLFRHDRGAFWMGAYGTIGAALPGYFVESRWGLPALGKLFSRQPLQNGPKEPGFLYRLFLGWAMTSRRLYSWLHKHSEEWVQNQCIIQDFCIPFSKSGAFIEKVIEHTGIFPLWLCPIASGKTAQIFSPHAYSQESLLINVGIYGIPRAPLLPADILRSLEEWTQSFKGRKLLYSYCQYTKDQFWQIYPRDAYEQLRRTYHAHRWMPIDHKVLMK